MPFLLKELQAYFGTIGITESQLGQDNQEIHTPMPTMELLRSEMPIFVMFDIKNKAV